MSAPVSKGVSGDDRAVLAACRAEIDALDAELVRIIAKRVDVVNRVVGLKRRHNIPALLPERVEDVVAHVREEAEAAGAPPDLAETVYRTMVNWIIEYEERQLASE